MREFPSLAIESRSVIVSTFTIMADCFLRATLGRLSCTEGNFTPEDTFKGKIIVMNRPVKAHNELGRFAQVLFKFIWQRAVERRISPLIKRKEAEQGIRPVFLWADESQFFANSYDALFQSTARSSRACTVYLTQNFPSYLSGTEIRRGKIAKDLNEEAEERGNELGGGKAITEAPQASRVGQQTIKRTGS